jgi:hypothetical protein
MLWHSVQLVGTEPVNVFECEACGKLAAVTATPASTSSSDLKTKAQA